MHGWSEVPGKPLPHHLPHESGVFASLGAVRCSHPSSPACWTETEASESAGFSLGETVASCLWGTALVTDRFCIPDERRIPRTWLPVSHARPAAAAPDQRSGTLCVKRRLSLPPVSPFWGFTGCWLAGCAFATGGSVCEAPEWMYNKSWVAGRPPPVTAD